MLLILPRTALAARDRLCLAAGSLRSCALCCTCGKDAWLATVQAAVARASQQRA